MDKFELHYQVALAKLERLHAIDRDVDTKATRSITLASAAVGAAVALGLAPEVTLSLIPAATYSAFLASLALPVATLWPRKWKDDPELPVFAEYVESGKHTDETMLRWMARQYSNAVEHNRSILKRKARLVRLSQLSASATVVLLVISAVLTSNGSTGA